MHSKLRSVAFSHKCALGADSVEVLNMFASIVDHAPTARCHVCGHPDIAAVCHHCGRLMCVSHRGQPPSGIDEWLSSEFSSLGLSEFPCGEEPVHCSECRHIVRSPRLIVIIFILL